MQFQSIHFSLSILSSSIRLIDRILSGATTPGQSRTGSDGNERVLRIPKSSCITRTPPSDYCHIQGARCGGGGLTPLQSCSRCILQSQPTGPQDTHYRGGGLTPLQSRCRCILQSQQTGSQETHCVGGSYPTTEPLSVYSTVPADWVIGYSLWEGVLPLYRAAVDVFYSPSQLGHRTLVVGCLTPLQGRSRCILQSQ